MRNNHIKFLFGKLELSLNISQAKAWTSKNSVEWAFWILKPQGFWIIAEFCHSNGVISIAQTEKSEMSQKNYVKILCNLVVLLTKY